MTDTPKTIIGLLYSLATDICDNYCKYPERYTEDEEEQLLKHCEDCPLNMLGV